MEQTMILLSLLLLLLQQATLTLSFSIMSNKVLRSTFGTSNSIYLDYIEDQQLPLRHKAGILTTSRCTTDSTRTRHITSTSTSTIGSTATTTRLQMVWWYGGSDSAYEKSSSEDDSCELVAVRIERTSSNSRRIYGEITVPVPMQNVWSILTDYDNLSTHVPNLVESRIVQRPGPGPSTGSASLQRQGDGQYQCRLYQKGAQKIIGFEFGASVTMDMKEVIIVSPEDSNTIIQKILFKCYDSFFFQQFDGEWSVYERTNPSMGTIESIVSYSVDVRPKGPVPVAALEWRIREDVPTNLRAVKKASMSTTKTIRPSDDVLLRSYELQQQQQQSTRTNGSNAMRKTTATTAAATIANQRNGRASPTLAKDARARVQWYTDETMAAYLDDR